MRNRQDHYFHKAKVEGYLSRAAYKLMEIDDRKRVLHRGDWVLDCGSWPGGWLQVAAERVGPRGAVIGVDLEPIRHQFPQQIVRTIEGDLSSIRSEQLLALAAQAGGGTGMSESPGSSDDRARSAPSSPVARATGSSGAASMAGSGSADSDLRSEISDLKSAEINRHAEDHRAGRRFDVILSDMAPKTTGDHTVDHHGSARLCDLVLSLCPGLLRPGGSLVMKIFEGERYPDLLARCRDCFKDVKGFKPKSSRSESREMYIIGQGFAGGARRDHAPAVNESSPPRPRPQPGW